MYFYCPTSRGVLSIVRFYWFSSAVYQEGFFRFSVGLEDAEDIIADLQQAMQAAGML